jgi:hypothetical protein
VTTDLVTTSSGMRPTAAQASLLAYVESKLSEAKAALEESEAALDQAKAHKWNTVSLRAIVNRNRKEYISVEKIKAAVQAGYVIMPWLPGQAFAVRIEEEKAGLPVNTVKDPSGWLRPGDNLANVQTTAPALGYGEYVSPRAKFAWYMREENKDGKIVKFLEEYGQDFISAIPFPANMAKPEIMSATEEAMARNIFDRICVFPGPRRRIDPIIYGEVSRPGREALCFLIAWLVRKEDV